MQRGESSSDRDEIERYRQFPPRTWCDYHEINSWLFPNPSELSQDGGPIGDLMRRLPGELLRDADRCPDPWAELCANRFIPAGFHELFHACSSVLAAAIHFQKRVYTRGDAVGRARRAKTPAQYEAAIRSLFPGVWRAGGGILAETASHKAPIISQEFTKREAQLLARISKKQGKATIPARPDKPTAEPLRRD